MAVAQATEGLVAVRARVRRVGDLLVESSPQSWESCQEVLEGAVHALTEYREQLVHLHPDEAARSAAHGLRADVVRTARLLQSLAAFYGGWERILGTMSAGYTVSGDPAPVERRGRLCCRG